MLFFLKSMICIKNRCGSCGIFALIYANNYSGYWLKNRVTNKTLKYILFDFTAYVLKFQLRCSCSSSGMFCSEYEGSI